MQRYGLIGAGHRAQMYLDAIGGAHADVAIWDPQVKRTIRHSELHDGADYSPYEGLEVTGWPTTVILGGRVMIRDNTLVGRKGDGTYRAARTRSSSKI